MNETWNEWEIMSELVLVVQCSVRFVHYFAHTHLVCQFPPPSTENICNYSFSCVLFFTSHSQYYWLPFLTPFILHNPAFNNTKRSRFSGDQGFHHPLLSAISENVHLDPHGQSLDVVKPVCHDKLKAINNTFSHLDVAHFSTQALPVKVEINISQGCGLD